MNNPLPIVFIHRGNSPYLAFTLGQARLQNPKSQIILLGDSTNKVFPFVTHVDLANHWHRAEEFAKIYVHLCTNGHEYELFCFQRWLALAEFAEWAGLESFLHLDSDVLLYVNATTEAQKWRDFDLTFVRQLCPGNMFVSRRRGIADLADIVWNMYADPNNLAELRRGYEERQSRGLAGGVCDMWAHLKFCQRHADRAGEMTGVQPDGSYWDANIHEAEGFETIYGIKNFRFVDGIPFARQIADGRNIRFKCIHFQGGAKQHIEPHFRAGLRPDVIARAA